MEPQGFQYQPEFLTRDEEQRLIERLQALEYSEVRMHGVIAKRRVIHYGWDYGYESWKITPTAPIPDFLLPLREQAAAFAGIQPDLLEEVLITDYPPGAPIGWHRDAPMFGLVVGISLRSACTMRFRKGPGLRPVIAHVLEPRSAYIIDGEARKMWQHSIPAVKDRRYSVAFRPLKSSTKATSSAESADGNHQRSNRR